MAAPFPDYELTDPPTGADTVRKTYRLGGQIVAVQNKVSSAREDKATGAFNYTHAAPLFLLGVSLSLNTNRQGAQDSAPSFTCPAAIFKYHYKRMNRYAIEYGDNP